MVRPVRTRRSRLRSDLSAGGAPSSADYSPGAAAVPTATAVVSPSPSPTPYSSTEWSVWEAGLPEYINNSDYETQNKEQHRFVVFEFFIYTYYQYSNSDGTVSEWTLDSSKAATVPYTTKEEGGWSSFPGKWEDGPQTPYKPDLPKTADANTTYQGIEVRTAFRYPASVILPSLRQPPRGRLQSIDKPRWGYGGFENPLFSIKFGDSFAEFVKKWRVERHFKPIVETHR